MRILLLGEMMTLKVTTLHALRSGSAERRS
jgi:hypothetical protein